MTYDDDREIFGVTIDLETIMKQAKRNVELRDCK